MVSYMVVYMLPSSWWQTVLYLYECYCHHNDNCLVMMEVTSNGYTHTHAHTQQDKKERGTKKGSVHIC